MENRASITERYERYRTEYSMITADLTKFARSGAAWGRRQRLLEKKLVECEKELHEIEAQIYSVLENIRDSRVFNLLEARIFMNLTWEEIADHLECDIRTVYRLRKFAYTEFDRIIAERDSNAKRGMKEVFLTEND